MSTKLSSSEPSIGESETKPSESLQAIETVNIGDASNKNTDAVSTGVCYNKFSPKTSECPCSPHSSGDFILVEKDVSKTVTAASDEIENYLWECDELEDLPSSKPVEIVYEISDDIDSNSDKILEDLCTPLANWRDLTEEKTPLKNENLDYDNDLKDCELCYQKVQALAQEGSNDDSDLEDYIKNCDQCCQDEDEEEVDDNVLRRWLENKLYYSGVPPDDKIDAKESIDPKASPRKIKIGEDDEETSSPVENASQWFQDSSFEFISQVSRLTQTDDSYLQAISPPTKEEEMDENKETTSEVVSSPEEISTEQELEEDETKAGSGEDDEDDGDDDANCINTEINENLEQLLESIHHIPPLKSGDGSCNMWMFPAHDENGNCMNVVLDDGEVYDIFVFRPGGPATSASTQVEDVGLSIVKTEKLK